MIGIKENIFNPKNEIKWSCANRIKLKTVKQLKAEITKKVNFVR